MHFVKIVFKDAKYIGSPNEQTVIVQPMQIQGNSRDFRFNLELIATELILRVVARNPSTKERNFYKICCPLWISVSLRRIKKKKKKEKILAVSFRVAE